MGKRKFDPLTNERAINSSVEAFAVSKSDKSVKQPQSQEDAVKSEKRAKSSSFDVKHFRKELAASHGQIVATTQFLKVCLNPDNSEDYLLEYLKAGGNAHEILRPIKQDNLKNLSLTTPVFHIFHLIILKVQSSLPHMISITEEACRYFLNNFMPAVEIMISENSGPRHRKIVLKLLTSMVTLNSDLGIEVLAHAPLTPKHLQHVVEKPNYKEVDNVRATFLLFMTSFLVDGHIPLIKALLEKQGLLAIVIPGLVHDDPEAVLMFLSLLKKNIIDSSLITKSLKLKTFNHHVLHNIFKLYSWKGPPEISSERKNEMHLEIVSSVSDIILILFTSHKLGLYFVDNTFGTTDVNKNQILYKALMTLKRPWENEYESEVILDIVYKCPDLHRALMNIIEQCFEPQHSPIWERTVEFTLKLLDKMKPENLVPRMSQLNATQTGNFIRFITLPVSLLNHIQVNISKDPTIAIYCVKLLVKMMTTLKRFMSILEMEDNPNRIIDLKNKLDIFLTKHLPLPTVIVSLIPVIVTNNENPEQKSKDYRLPKIRSTDSLIYLIDLLLLYNDIHPSFFEILAGNIEMKQILEYSSTLTTGNIPLLKFKIVSLWTSLDQSVISLKSPLFKELFIIMLEVYVNEEGKTWMEAKNTLYQFLKNTAIFEEDEYEIHLLLYTLRNAIVSPISMVADIVEDILLNQQKLMSEFRNKMANFELCEENSESALQKLFDDLMKSQNTQDSVFLENAVPSIFIEGCMQFMRNNKEAKKNLKNFISLYIVNLFHCNYSPKLTEVLIGDSKLDVRHYITSWIIQPVSLPDYITTKDSILRNITKAIIDNEDKQPEEVFEFLVKCTKEDEDIEINNIPLKVCDSIDSSDLLVWAKYIIFCMIRLTKTAHLNEETCVKSTNYINCLITVGRKLHLMNECRMIMQTLIKNPHLLEIYKPIVSKSTDTNFLATKFLLDIITLNKDVVIFLDNKMKILKSYQQKNFFELIKSVVKINKINKFDSTHTGNVIKVIGMSTEDDMTVFNKIFSLDVTYHINDDKEPSFVLDVLQILIEKYSNIVSVDTPEHIIRKSVKLYTELLANKDINVNLTNLECALINYFVNKPHHAAYINEELFKKFFNASTVRKTTSHLASVLIKYNAKLCSEFKEQINKTEILCQRELTLPLANAALNHKHFFIEKKDILMMIFKEYRSNILKMLEKPHKAGQIYTACWKLIRKLVIECMDIEDCQKVFTKNHKFEVAEESHINVLHAAFMKLYVTEKCTTEHIANYLIAMINICTIALNLTIAENRDIRLLYNIVENVYNVVLVSQFNEGFDMKDEAVSKIVQGAVWQNFCKAVIKDSLKVKTASQNKTAGPPLLFLLTNLVKLLYAQDHEDIITLFDMVTSHSEFLNVMLSHHSSEIKSRLVEFLYTLLQLNKSMMKPQQIPVYLSAYHATRSACDRLILAILLVYESNGLPVNDYKPYVFGDSAANHYAVRKNKSPTLWGLPTPNRVLSLYDRDIIEKTIRHFPVTQKLEYHYELRPCIEINDVLKNSLHKILKEGIFKAKAVRDKESAINHLLNKVKYEIAFRTNSDVATVSHLDDSSDIYDPVFLFPLLSHLLAPGSVASCFKLMRTGLLSVTVMALSSQCPRMRAAGYHVLHRFCLLLETETRHKNDKLFLTDFLNTLRRSLSTAINNPSEENGELGNLRNPRLPVVSALYLARALMVSAVPGDPLYKPVNNFFIAKQQIDFSVVPDFLTLFHDSDVEAVDRRLWILEIIRDGTKTIVDINMIFKTMCLKMIMDFYYSTLSNKKVRERILSVVNACITVPRALEILLEGYGLMSWLHAAVRQLDKDDKVLIRRMFGVIENILHSLIINTFVKQCATQRNGNKFTELKVSKDIEYEIVRIIYELLQHTDSLDVEDVISYVKIYNLLSKRTVKSLTKVQILSLLGKTSAMLERQDAFILLTSAVINNDVSILMSKCLNVEDSTPSNDLLKELISVANTYVSL